MPPRIVTLGPEGTYSHTAARQYMKDAEIVLLPSIRRVYDAFAGREADMALLPVYNTVDGHIEESFRHMLGLPEDLYWTDNVVMPIEHVLGSLDRDTPLTELRSESTVFQQCAEYIGGHFPDIAMVPVDSTAKAAEELKSQSLAHVGVIASREALESRGLVVRDEGLVANNRTRFAVLGTRRLEPTGYDATGVFVIPSPVADQNPGWLTYASEQFSGRDINLLDIDRFTDTVTRSMVFYFECEGHADSNAKIREAMDAIRNPELSGRQIRASSVVRLLGSYPRVTMEERAIKTIGFIGTGAFTDWHMDWFGRQGYRTLKAGRTSELTPEKMIEQADAVALCVPISAAVEATRKYAPLLRPGQLWIDLTGEKERTLKAAKDAAAEGVEVMGIHELWGPKVRNLGHKNAVFVEGRGGRKCQEMEAVYRRNWVNVVHDTPEKHDMYVGAEQKLPQAVAMAMAAVMKKYGISPDDMGDHSTATSVYMHMLMARVHGQNPRTYAEIQASNREGSDLLRGLIEELRKVRELGDKGDVQALKEYIEENREHLQDGGQLTGWLEASKHVDELLSR